MIPKFCAMCGRSGRIVSKRAQSGMDYFECGFCNAVWRTNDGFRVRKLTRHRKLKAMEGNLK